MRDLLENVRAPLFLFHLFDLQTCHCKDTATDAQRLHYSRQVAQLRPERSLFTTLILPMSSAGDGPLLLVANYRHPTTAVTFYRSGPARLLCHRHLIYAKQEDMWVIVKIMVPFSGTLYSKY